MCTETYQSGNVYTRGAEAGRVELLFKTHLMAARRQGWNLVSGLEVTLGSKAAAQGPGMSHRSSLRV